MFSAKIKGDWKAVNSLLKKYKKRVDWACKETSRMAAENLLDYIKDNIPSDEKYNSYRESLSVVRIKRVSKGRFIYGILAEYDGDKISYLKSAKNTYPVVYIVPISLSNMTESVALISSVNPWPIHLLPKGFKKNSVRFVHRFVLEGESKSVELTISEFIKNNKDILLKNGFVFGVENIQKDDESTDEMSSKEDFLWTALRLEFGINEKSRPVWRPGVKWLLKKMQSFIRKNKNLKKVLQSHTFKEHNKTDTDGRRRIDKKEFRKETKEFSKKVLGKR